MSKLLFFSPYYYPYVSGYVTYPQQLLSQLSIQHDITVLTFRHTEKIKHNEIYNGQNILRMGYWLRISKGFISPSSFWHYFRQANRADTILINLPNVEGLPLAIIARLLRKRVICLFHCDVNLGKGIFPAVLNSVMRWAVKSQLKLAHRIVTTTHDYIDSLPYRKIFDHKTDYAVSCIGPPEICITYLDELLAEKKNSFYIGFCGRVSREKGLEYLIQALNQVSHKNLKVTLLIAGPHGVDVSGEEQYMSFISEELNKTKLSHKFLGILDKPRLGAFYQAIDLLVLPSINQTEAYGIVQIEAMMANTPVITTDLPGVRIPIRESGFGEVVKPMNSTQLATVVEKALLDPPQYDQNLLQRFLGKFDIGIVVANFERILFK